MTSYSKGSHRTATKRLKDDVLLIYSKSNYTILPVTYKTKYTL